MREWEDAGASLARSLSKYMELCASLGPKSLEKGAHPQKLVTRIDHALESLHATLDQQLAQSRSILAQTRNNIMSPIYSFPEEVLSEIFMHVVFSPATDDLPIASMKDHLLGIFTSLHHLQGVCRIWRSVVLACGVFWSIAPVFCSRTPRLRCVKATNLSIQRCKRDLYLAAVLEAGIARAFRTMKGNTMRFRTINITANSHHQLREPLIKLLKCGSFPRLNELSMHTETDLLESRRILEDDDYVITSRDNSWNPFLVLLKSLSTLRISGVNFIWGEMAFSNRLVELRIQRVVIGDDTELADFINTLSTASNLRDLKLISVHSFADMRTFSDKMAERGAFFPSLKTLLLEDLPHNTLYTLLQTIISESHQLALFATPKSVEVISRHPEPDFIDLQDLFHALEPTVDTLLISAEEQTWLSPRDIRTLLELLPSLKTLKMHSWSFNEEHWADLELPQNPRSPFPKLDCLYLSCAVIRDEELLKDVVTSHSIRRMVLGASLCDEEDTSASSPLQGDEEI
ncbi:hypothetical protein FRC11_002871, partial [Ceratobasidium sp. 423]